MTDLPSHPGIRKEPLGPLVDPYLDSRMRMPPRLAQFVDGAGACSAFEADIVRAILRSIFAPPRPDKE